MDIICIIVYRTAWLRGMGCSSLLCSRLFVLLVYRHDLKSLPTTEHVLVCHLTTGMCVDQGGLDNMGMVQGKPNLSTGKIQSTCILEDSIPPLLFSSSGFILSATVHCCSVLLTGLAWLWLMCNKARAYSCLVDTVIWLAHSYLKFNLSEPLLIPPLKDAACGLSGYLC